MERDWQTAGFVIDALRDSRQRTLELIGDLTDEQLRVPLLPIINPIVWEIGHVGWFQEKWALRHARGEAPLLEQGDSLWDSAAVAHDTRWDLPLPSRNQTLDFMARVLDKVVAGLTTRFTEEDRYFCWLAIMHEDMHGEALTYTRQTLGFAPPPHARRLAADRSSPPGDVEFAGGEFMLGAHQGEPLVFDNEKWEHPVHIEPFAMAKTLTTQGQFAEFVDDGGYNRPEFWSEDGWQWRSRTHAKHPVYWTRDGEAWQLRWFDRIVPLNPGVPHIHVNWYEADACCRWAGRRLPSEAEWEFAAATPDGLHNMTGAAWQWTSGDFGPYPGFVRDPYKEYSEPWFGPPYKVLRGSCWATQPRLVRNTWRNFYTKDRRDVFGGFRTCRSIRD